MSDVIWAPWRMEFILGKKPPECVLCGYADVAPAPGTLVLAQGSLAYVVLNKYPYTAGHIMVVPHRHVSDPAELQAHESNALWRMVQASIAPLRAATRCPGMNIGMNVGQVAGAGIHEHIHVHLVPRWDGDNNFMPAVANIRVMPEYLEDSWQRLAPAFADLGKELTQ
jgi:ATP adenylyltransferase